MDDLTHDDVIDVTRACQCHSYPSRLFMLTPMEPQRSIALYYIPINVLLEIQAVQSSGI